MRKVGNVYSAEEIDAMIASGQYASRDVPTHTGGSRGYIEGAPREPSARMVNQVGLKSEEWRGSSAIYQDHEMPPAGYGGSNTVVSLADVDRMERAHGIFARGKGSQQVSPGAYQMDDGNILVVATDGSKMVLSPVEYANMARQIAHQRTQQLPQEQRKSGMESLTNRLLEAARRRLGQQ
jgi:hypothetical protein